MYRGSGVNILLIAPEKGIKLAANDLFRYYLTTNGEPLTLFRGAVAGGLAGLLQIIVTTPMELLKIQMQNAGRVSSLAKVSSDLVPPKVSATSIAIEILRSKGIFGLYKGVFVTGLRDVSFSVIYFPMVAKLTSLGPRTKDGSGETVFYWTFFSGLISGCMAALAANPFDVIKTRLQVLKKAEGESHYSGVGDAFIKTFRNEGFRAFFKGGVCRVMVIAPLFGIAQMVYYLGVAERIFGN
ncbi:hypothetical protein WDU94_002203 [Cyamophila willieti]